MGNSGVQMILSRKGFDSGYGGIPSPILPDGRLMSLPIPATHDVCTFSDLNMPGVDVGHIIADLSRHKYSMNTTIHLDPDLDRAPTSRFRGWRPALGQTGNAQSHLRDMGVGRGDVFIFFGWFRQIEYVSGVWRFAKNAPHLHVMFGWIEIEEVLPIVEHRDGCLSVHPWIANHPHLVSPDHYSDPRNTLYVASAKSRFNPNCPYGGGRFKQYSNELRLTQVDCSRSVWSLPAWFLPREGLAPLSYHPRSDQWINAGDRVTLRSAAKGQEFVLDGAHYPEVEGWVGDIVRNHA